MSFLVKSRAVVVLKQQPAGLRCNISSFLRRPQRNDITAFQNILNHRSGSVIIDPYELERYNIDWTRQYVGTSRVVLKPCTTLEVSAILKHCHENNIGIVPQGGNTGLVGGSVSTHHEEVTLSTEAMTHIDSFDSINGVLQCQTGCILQHLQEYVSPYNYLIPIDLGSKGSCTIGGNVSTNAGGQYYYRFGSIHSNLLGLEVVLADGTIIDMMNSNRKDNTGYHLKNIFVGAEGTLGLITKVSLSCPPLPRYRSTAFMVCHTFKNVLNVLQAAKTELGEILAALEFMDSTIIRLVSEKFVVPMSSIYKDDVEKYYVLIETQGSNSNHDTDKMNTFLSQGVKEGYIEDGVCAQTLDQVMDMWKIRESCNPTIKSLGYNYKYDVSLPLQEIPIFIDDVRLRLSIYPEAILCNWGHLVDGNLHINIVTRGKFVEDLCLKQNIDPFIYSSVYKRSGSISAEHGIGQSKREYQGLYKTTEAANLMRRMKLLFDPLGILNPGKVIPEL